MMKSSLAMVGVLLCIAIAALSSSASFPSPSPSPSSSQFEDSGFDLARRAPPPPTHYNYPIVSFTTAGATTSSYRKLINDLRAQLRAIKGAKQSRGGLPVLAPLSQVDISKRFILVELTNAGRRSITLVIDVVNIYYVAFKAGKNCFYFDEVRPSDVEHCFTDTSIVRLGISSSYPGLESEPNQRKKLDLGMQALDDAISTLSKTVPTLVAEFKKTVRKPSMVIIQMIAEAARFHFIETEMLEAISERRKPSDPMLSLENEWGKLSKQIQMSRQGIFIDPVEVTRRSTQKERFDNIALTVPLMGFLNNGVDTTTKHPTARIKGVNGLCLGTDANQVVLLDCGSNRQVWTLRDETIRSATGQCLRGDNRGTVAMGNCNDNAATWEMSDDGTLQNKGTRRVLTAGNGVVGTIVTLETNANQARQGWQVTNIERPHAMAIRVHGGLCLETQRTNNLGLGACRETSAEQNWALYPDGSIRPQAQLNRCITCTNRAGAELTLTNCVPTASNQRWVFKAYGEIMNLQNKLVMENNKAKIIISRPKANELNQIWTLAL